MRVVIREVYSLKGIDPAQYIGDFFILPDGEVFQAQTAQNELGGIGDFFKSIGKIALNIGGGLIGLKGIGDMLLSGNSGKVKGAKAVTEFGNQLLAEMDAILPKLQSGEISGSQATEAANSLAAILSDGNRVFQHSSGGTDDKTLKSYKAQAAEKAQQIKAFGDELERQRIAFESEKAAEEERSKADAIADDQERSQNPFGLKWSEIAIGAGILFFLMRR